MTDNEQMEKVFRKIQLKYPYITNKDEVINLAIKLDKRNIIIKSGAFILGAIVCTVVFFLLINNEMFESTRTLFLIMACTGIFECFRTLGKYSKVEQRYRPVLRVKYEGELTRDKLIKDGGKALKNVNYSFKLLTLPLYDKEDETDMEVDSVTHTYYFHFQHSGIDGVLKYKVKKAQYIDAVLGSEYFVVLIPGNKIITVYQKTNWSVADDLKPHMIATEISNDVIRENIQTAENIQSTVPLYQMNAVQISTQREKTKKLLPILALVFMVLSYLMPLIVGVPMGIAAFALAVVGLTKQRTVLTVTSLIINAVLFFLLIIGVVGLFFINY